MRAMQLSVLLGLLLSTYGCSCDKCSILVLELPTLNLATTPPVTVEIRQVAGSTSLATCAWTSSATGRSTWTCTKDRDGTTTRNEDAAFYYNTEQAANSWSITLTGPSGSQTITRKPQADDSGEWPGCSCDAYRLVLTGADAQSVGAIPLESSSTTPSDAGVDAG
jgi:hypothetical protein